MNKKLIVLGAAIFALIFAFSAQVVHAQTYTDAEIVDSTATGACGSDTQGQGPVGNGTKLQPAGFYNQPDHYCFQQAVEWIDQCANNCGLDQIDDNRWFSYNNPYVAYSTGETAQSSNGGSNVDNSNTSFSVVASASLTANPSSIVAGNNSALTWSSNLASSCTGTGFSTGGATSGTVAVSPTATTNYSVTCTGPDNSTSANAVVTVIQPSSTLATSCSVSPTSVVVGNPVTWSSATTGGTAPYTYLWSGDAPLAGNTASNASVTYTTPGLKSGSVTVTDSDFVATSSVKSTNNQNNAVCTGTQTSYTAANEEDTAVLASAETSAMNQADDTFTDTSLGWPAAFYANTQNYCVQASVLKYKGVNGYSTTATLYTGNGTRAAQASDYGVSGGVSSAAFLGEATQTVTVTPAAGPDVVSQACNATVNVIPALTASCSVSPSTAVTGQSVTWTAAASGGVGPYSYSWGGSVSGTANPETTNYSSAGNYSGNVTITSADGEAATAQCSPGGSSNPVVVQSCVPALSANPSTIVVGQQSTLTWSEPAACASSCVFADGTTEGLSGTRVVTPAATSNYALTCGIPANTTTTGITVNVPSITITPAENLVAKGATAILSWVSSNVSSCTMTRNGASWSEGSTTSATNVTDPTPITGQTIYKATCVTAGNPVYGQATVNVAPQYTTY